jgi:hypothetical protein
MSQRPSGLDPTSISYDVFIEDITCPLIGDIGDPYGTKWHRLFLHMLIEVFPERLKQLLPWLAA